MTVETLKITNPVWLGQIGPMIQKLADRIQIKTITYETLYSYFAQSVQFGGETSEFHCAFINKKPVAFAHWMLRGLPHVGTTYMDFIFSKAKRKDVVTALADQWIIYGKKHRCRFFEGDSRNSYTMRLFKSYANRMNLKIEETGIINFLAWEMPKNESHNKNGDKDIGREDS